MRQPGNLPLRYVIIRMTTGGRFLSSVYTNKDEGEKYYNCVRMLSNIWAAIIQYNRDTGEARTLSYFRDGS